MKPFSWSSPFRARLVKPEPHRVTDAGDERFPAHIEVAMPGRNAIVENSCTMCVGSTCNGRNTAAHGQRHSRRRARAGARVRRDRPKLWRAHSLKRDLARDASGPAMAECVGTLSLSSSACEANLPLMKRSNSPSAWKSMPGPRTRRVAMFAFPDVQILDVTGPLEVFARTSRWLRDHGKRTDDAYSV